MGSSTNPHAVKPTEQMIHHSKLQLPLDYLSTRSRPLFDKLGVKESYFSKMRF